MKLLKGPVPSPDTADPSTAGCIRITLFLRKLPGVSDDYFHAYWANNHVAPALRSPVFMHKVKKYVQCHATPAMKEKAKALGAPVLDYDGVAETWVTASTTGSRPCRSRRSSTSCKVVACLFV